MRILNIFRIEEIRPFWWLWWKNWFTISIFVVYNSKTIGNYQKNPRTESSFHAGCRWQMEYS